LIPVEIYELTRRFTALRVAALVVNIAAVIYLVYRLRHPRAQSETVSFRASEASRGIEAI
jgi:uncharacterized membrane protein (DUF2068 family)